MAIPAPSPWPDPVTSAFLPLRLNKSRIPMALLLMSREVSRSPGLDSYARETSTPVSFTATLKSLSGLGGGPLTLAPVQRCSTALLLRQQPERPGAYSVRRSPGVLRQCLRNLQVRS